MKAPTLLPLLLLLLSCSSKSGEWKQVDLLDSELHTERKTACTTNHQGGYDRSLCLAYLDDDTLHIDFPAELPAHWLGVRLTSVDGKFKAEVGGVPLGPTVEVEHQIKKQLLQLNKTAYAVGDTLQGYVELVFEERNKTQGYKDEYYHTGSIYKIVTTKDYNPFDDKAAFMSYDLDLAVNEMGQPEEEYEFTTLGLHEFRIELLNIFPASDSIHIRELTWNTSDDAQVSDGGIYRLTVWYAKQGEKWMPVDFARWTTDMQF